MGGDPASGVEVGPAGGMTVLCCRSDASAKNSSDSSAGYDAADVRPVLGACADAGPVLDPVHYVGRRPKKPIDQLLTGRVLVIGDDADLNAVILRLVRKNLLADVELAYAPTSPTALTRLYGLPSGPDAVAAAVSGVAGPVPLARHDSGGVLVGRAELTPITTPFYVDEHRFPAGPPRTVSVTPHPDRGLLVRVAPVRPSRIRAALRRLGLGRGTGAEPEPTPGRAVEFGIPTGSGTTITYDGIPRPRATNRWVFYAHTEPLRLVRPA